MATEVSKFQICTFLVSYIFVSLLKVHFHHISVARRTLCCEKTLRDDLNDIGDRNGGILRLNEACVYMSNLWMDVTCACI